MKRAFTLVEAVIVVGILLILAAILWPVFQRRGYEPTRSSCQANLKQIWLGFAQYAQDYDERFPRARLASSDVGWADMLQPYVKSTQLFQCSKAPLSATGIFTTDYFYNRRLSRVETTKVSVPSFTILSGDGPDNAPTWSFLAQLPADATTNTDSFAQRHPPGEANYGFADGHVKFFKPDAISTGPVKEGKPTFALH